METKHTPGPWKVLPESEASNPFIVASSETGLSVADCYCPIGGNNQANARLIAAAPELLEALRRIDTGQEMTGNFAHADTVLRYQEIARAAIAKATGQS